MQPPLPRRALAAILCFSLLMCVECSPQAFAPAQSALSALSALEGGGNGSSALAALALQHLQHKADALAQLAEVLALGANATEALFLN